MTKLLLALSALTMACGSTPSGATCPATNAPTYASFGQAFFATYCTACHSASSTDRDGAPSDVNFDTEQESRDRAADIDDEAAAGPRATNVDMPELDARVTTPPTVAEREQLGQFLACEAGIVERTPSSGRK